jgi:hypothetical protein
MIKLKIFKEFPRGGALGKRGKNVVFIKHYWNEGLDVVFVYEDDIREGPKGLYVHKWAKVAPIDIVLLEQFRDEEKNIEQWRFPLEGAPIKSVIRKKYIIIPQEHKSSVWEHKDIIKEHFKRQGWDEVLFMVNDEILLTKKIKEETLNGDELKAYKEALGKATELANRSEKVYMHYYGADEIIRECLENGTKFEEGIQKIEAAVVRSEKKFKRLLQQFKMANEFNLFEIKPD